MHLQVINFFVQPTLPPFGRIHVSHIKNEKVKNFIISYIGLEMHALVIHTTPWE